MTTIKRKSHVAVFTGITAGFMLLIGAYLALKPGLNVLIPVLFFTGVTLLATGLLLVVKPSKKA